MTEPTDLTKKITTWREQEVDRANKLVLGDLLEGVLAGRREALSLAQEMFCCRLSFGTAGLRGPLRPGPNGMNRIVVSQTTAGLATYLLTKRGRAFEETIHVVVGFDGRHQSDVFGEDTAEIFSGHGIRATRLPWPVPTPVLAFAVRELNAEAGVMVTASHNPATDNGYKVYLGGEDCGSQIVPPVDQQIENFIGEVVERLSFSKIPRSRILVHNATSELIGGYIQATLSVLPVSVPGPKAISVVYTAMHGVGGNTFLAAMDAAGFPKPTVVEQQFEPDPDFPTVAFPNPEETGALDLSFVKGRSVGADLIIAHDPDADRLAVALPDSSTTDGYRALTGNQVGAIFGWHIAGNTSSSGKTGTLANSLVSSPVLGKIAKHFGLSHEETLTGFKYVSRVKNLIFGFEEALGYLVTPDVVRDKDGISAGLLMVSLANSLAQEGRTLWDYLRTIEECVGAFASGQVTIRLGAGVPGPTVTATLREKDLEAIGPRAVTRRDDFLDGVGDFPADDILRYYLDDGTRVIARPSGTEPKVKIYIDTEGSTSAQAEAILTEVEADINELVNSL